MKRVFEKDTTGFYITPLFGYSNIKGKKSIWFGWAWYLWSWVLTTEDKKCQEAEIK